jgi:hypothetical protein
MRWLDKVMAWSLTCVGVALLLLAALVVPESALADSGGCAGCGAWATSQCNLACSDICNGDPACIANCQQQNCQSVGAGGQSDGPIWLYYVGLCAYNYCDSTGNQDSPPCYGACCAQACGGDPTCLNACQPTLAVSYNCAGNNVCGMKCIAAGRNFEVCNIDSYIRCDTAQKDGNGNYPCYTCSCLGNGPANGICACQGGSFKVE